MSDRSESIGGGANLFRLIPCFRGGLVVDSEGPPEDNLHRILDRPAYGRPLPPGPWSAAGP